MSPSRSGFSALLEEADRPVLLRRAQVHVAKPRPQAGVTCELLDGERWRVPHCQMRAERVPQDVQRPLDRKPCPLRVPDLLALPILRIGRRTAESSSG